MSFCKSVYDIVKKVPKGKVITYKGIAEILGTKAHRAVGTCMKKNSKPHSVSKRDSGKSQVIGGSNNCPQISPNTTFISDSQSLIPCHRVVCSNGNVGHFNDGIKKKIQLLRIEGIEIEIDSNNLEKSKIINFKSVKFN